MPQEQYFEGWENTIKHIEESLNSEINKYSAQGLSDSEIQAKIVEDIQPKFNAITNVYFNAIKVYCKDIPQVKMMVQQYEMQQAMQEQPQVTEEEDVTESDSTNTNVNLDQN